MQVLAGLQYSLPPPDMGLSQQQTHWVLAALAAQGQQQLQGSVSAALALSHTNPAGLFGHFPASQLQVNPLQSTLFYPHSRRSIVHSSRVGNNVMQLQVDRRGSVGLDKIADRRIAAFM